MPNLLKSLPREILDNEDSKFIYNVLNPLLFEKIKDSDTDTIITHKVSSLLNKDINHLKQFLPEFIMPININSREFHVYMSGDQETKKIEYFGKTDLVSTLDELKEYIFFFFSFPEYKFLETIIKKYYFIDVEYQKNKKEYELNYNNYQNEKDIKKKKVYKSTYEHFKTLYTEFDILKKEFNYIFDISMNNLSLSVGARVDLYATTLGNFLSIKSFDNDIIFSNSKLYNYLSSFIETPTSLQKHIFSGKTIISTTEYMVENVFELISLFSMELVNIKMKYDEYLKLLIDNGNGYALERSDFRKLKNEKFDEIIVNLDSDNLTYFIDEQKNTLEIYLYFSKEYRIDESTFKLDVNSRIITKSIHSLTGERSYGYDLFEYFDDDTKYYKITIHKFLQYDLDDIMLNYDIENITVKFTAVKAIYYIPTHSQDLYFESMGFLDCFTLYGKNEQTGFFENLNVPYKVKINIEEKDERYVRSYEFNGINPYAHRELLSQTEIIIGCYDYDYVYEPKLYIDFFRYMNNDINFRFNTILPFVLVDDIIEKDFEIQYYERVTEDLISTNIDKNILMYDNSLYRMLFDDVNQYRLLNPYNETQQNIVSKITYNQYLERNHINPIIIDSILDKLLFKDNLKYLDMMNYDELRNMLIFVFDGYQYGLPLEEPLYRGLNYENLKYDPTLKKMLYYGEQLCENGFKFVYDGIYLMNTIRQTYEKMEIMKLISINTSKDLYGFYFDIYEMSLCVNIDGKKFKMNNIYVDTYSNALNYNGSILFIESKYGILRYKIGDNIIDINEHSLSLNNDLYQFVYDDTNKSIILSMFGFDDYIILLTELEVRENKHRNLGITGFSLFYAGNVIPENTNKQFFGRENIYNSMFLIDDIYKLGRGGDNINDYQQHALLAEQMDLNIEDSEKYNLEEESYLMFKSSTASFKGLESYLKSNLKSISQNVGISPVYLVQRNRFISEWARVSNILPNSIWVKDALKDLIADLLETKLLTKNYDDLIDIFKNNEYEKFSLDTNNMHGIIIQYILRFVNEYNLSEQLSYYLLYNVWLENNRKKIIDYIKNNASESIIALISTMKFKTSYENEQLFYIFIELLDKTNKNSIDSYIPIGNYSDWQLYVENNNVKFKKPYKYDIIDISQFITMPIEWNLPLYLIRPLVDDGITVKRDYRFLDISMVTNMQVTYDDSYNEYIDNIKNIVNRPVNYLDETLKILNALSISGNFDILSINLVIVKWIVERYLPNYMINNTIETVDELKQVIFDELNSAEHPNMIVSYNKIKENTLLGDIGTNINDIYENIIDGDLVNNSIIRLTVTSNVELEYLDKVKKPVEHFFDFLIYAERYDIVTKVLSLFTEDVIATSMIDLSFAINIKNMKGDETFSIYEKMIFSIFDEFLPFHTVLDKIIFSILIMESTSSEAVSKNADVSIVDKNIIDVMSKFVEKIRIQIHDRTITSSRISALFPSEGLKLCGGHDEIPYDYDRKVKVGGHDIPMHMDDFEAYGMDDDWYIINRDIWKQRADDIYTPPEFANLVWSCIPDNEFERVAEVYIDEYYHIKQNIFEKDEKIESYFIDFVPTIDINQGISENPEINVVEDYLINIDSIFKIRFYDLESLGHDDFGQDETWGPEDQTTLIGAKDAMYHTVMHDFYDKLYVNIMDSIWSDIKLVYDLINIPGHDDFGIDEYYHQKSPDLLGQDISVMVYDGLLEQSFRSNNFENLDISLIDKQLASKIIVDYERIMMNTYVSDQCFVNVAIDVNRNFDKFGHFLYGGHDEFLYDEYYHNSTDYSRLANMVDIATYDFLGDIRIDFGFMRILPIDPYIDLINQKFYRANLPGSDWQRTNITDSMIMDIRIYGRDIIRVGLMDFIMIDIVDENLRHLVYKGIEAEKIGGDFFASNLSDSLLARHIHHDFRENILAVDKYASIISDADILNIYGIRGGNFERDELFKLSIGDNYYANIKIKQSIDRASTKIDKDYLKSIKVEEDNFVSFKYVDKTIDVQFEETLKSYLQFVSNCKIDLTDNQKVIINQLSTDEDLDIQILDNVLYGDSYEFDIDGMQVSISDDLIDMWSNKIYKDSMILSLTETTNIIDTNLLYTYGSEKLSKLHDYYGHMGYTDESIDRSIASKLKDSLLQISKEIFFEADNVNIYDGLMQDIKEYAGDFIDVVISESVHTYVHIVKKPWVLAEFDDYGHNFYPHMYNGDSDEFDITTQLKDSLKIDSYTKLYTTASLVALYEKIYTGYGIKQQDFSSISMNDSLKIIGMSFIDDTISISSSDQDHTKKKLTDDLTNIYVQDRIWYGYKLRDSEAFIDVNDKVQYKLVETPKFNESLLVSIHDSLYYNYTLLDTKQKIKVSDSIYNIDDLIEFSDLIKNTITDRLITIDSDDRILFNDVISVKTNDNIIISTDVNLYDTTQYNEFGAISIKEKLEYGRGKKFKESVGIFLLNRMSILDRNNQYLPDLNIKLVETIQEIFNFPFKESLNVDGYERLKFGPVFKDYSNIVFSEMNDVRLLFMDDRYGVDNIPNDYGTMEYYNDAANRTIASLLMDDIKLINTHYSLNEKLTILSSDQLSVGDNNTIISVKSYSDGIVVISNDNLMYGIGMYDYIWDAKEWDQYGYNVPYENWHGLIPHDEFPYDNMEHDQQGEDISQITTGVSDVLIYGFNFLFKDTLKVSINDDNGLSTWEYQSLFKDFANVYVTNKLDSSWDDTVDSNTSNINLKKELLRVSYEFNDAIKKHLFIEKNGIVVEEINIHDINTFQIIETIMKYRIYEQIGVNINEYLYDSTLFKYDEELSLIMDYKTKIDLYKTQSDGSIARSMTVIKDKSSALVELLFNDKISMNMKERFHATYAEKPSEYLD